MSSRENGSGRPTPGLGPLIAVAFWGQHPFESADKLSAAAMIRSIAQAHPARWFAGAHDTRSGVVNQLVMPNGITAPALGVAAGDRAGVRFLEFFASAIRNPHTRRAYARAAGDFLAS